MNIKERQKLELWNLREIQKAGTDDSGNPLGLLAMAELATDIEKLEQLLGEEAK